MIHAICNVTDSIPETDAIICNPFLRCKTQPPHSKDHLRCGASFPATCLTNSASNGDCLTESKHTQLGRWAAGMGLSRPGRASFGPGGGGENLRQEGDFIDLMEEIAMEPEHRIF